MNTSRFFTVILLAAISATQSFAVDAETRLRRPVALALSNDGQWLFTANRDSGSVSVIDTVTGSVTNEIDICAQLSAVATFGDRHLLALDQSDHQVILLTGSGSDWAVAAKLVVAEHPGSIVVDEAENRCFVASLWSRTITEVGLSAVSQDAVHRLNAAATVQLPFEPREMCFVADKGKLIVADAFAGTLVVLDARDLNSFAVRDIGGHNIRGLALSSDRTRLLVSQQELNPLARASRDDIHWGNMITNQLAEFPLADVFDGDAALLNSRDITFLGETRNAAADPGSICVTPNGNVFVLLSGVDEVALGREDSLGTFRRLLTGRRPIALIGASDARVYIADTFSDSVTVVDFAEDVSQQISLGPSPDLSLAQQGELLFHSGLLSHDGWMSCHSCHPDGHSNGQLNDNLSDGSFGTPKRVLSLQGVSETGPWAWNGKIESLEEQVAGSIVRTMQGVDPRNEQVAAIVAFLRTLPPPPQLHEAAAGHPVDIHDGQQLFATLGCVECHAPPTFTSPDVFDVGLADSAGNRLFNPPSLRGAGRRRMLFHDGSAESVRGVLDAGKHQLDAELSDSEVDSLVNFLRSI